MSPAGSVHDGLVAETLALAKRWCAIASVRGAEDKLRAMAGELVDWLSGELGAELVPDGLRASPPIIHARLDAGRAATVILYSMYDVMPASPDGWISDPFGGEVVELLQVGPAFIARGAENNKGPLAGMLVALKALVDRDSLPVNVELIIEGQEESGSRALRAYLDSSDCPLRPAAAALFASLCEYGGGPPRLYLGFSGIAKGVVSVAGGAWGGPSRAVHSSNAPWLANPASRLVQAVHFMAAPPTGRMATVALDDDAHDCIARLAASFDAAAELRFRSSEAFAMQGSSQSLLETLLSTASFNVAWLSTEPWRDNGVIPCRAEAGFDLRAPPGLDPAGLLAEAAERLSRSGITGIEFEVDDSYPGHRFAPGAVGVAELVEVYSRHGRPAQIWPWAPGAAPAYAFARHVEAFLIGGLGNGGNAHGINEFMAVGGIERFLASVIDWLEAMGGPDSSNCNDTMEEVHVK